MRWQTLIKWTTYQTLHFPFFMSVPDGNKDPACEHGHLSFGTHSAPLKYVSWQRNNRSCNLWHRMFTKRPQSLDFLNERFVHSSMEEDIVLYFVEIDLSKICSAGFCGVFSSYFCLCSWNYVEVITQKVKFLACHKCIGKYKVTVL